MSNQYTPQQVADFILKYAENQEVKQALKKHGYNIVPNSLAKLIENLEKVGFIVLKKDEYEKLTQQNQPAATSTIVQDTPKAEERPVVEQPTNQTTTLQILGGLKTENTVSNLIPEEPKKEEKKEIIDPFGDSTLQPKTNQPEQKSSTTVENKNETTTAEIPKRTEDQKFEHKSPALEEPNEPFEKLWFDIKQKAKDDSIAFYSLIVNAQPELVAEENKLVIGFTNKHTYQMNQFKRQDNLDKFKNILRELTKKEFTVVCEVVADKPVKPQHSEPNVSTTQEYQILGGKDEKGDR